MTFQRRAVTVKQLPAVFGREQERAFLRELESSLKVSRPCIVLDCSQTQQMDKSAVHLLLCCLEEAMKLNGDVRLAAVRPGTRVNLRLLGIDRLFKIFETTAEATDSFQRAHGYAAYGEKKQHAENAA